MPKFNNVPTWIVIAIVLAILAAIVIAFMFGIAVREVFAAECTHAWISPTPTCKWDAMWYLYEMRRQGIHYSWLQ